MEYEKMYDEIEFMDVDYAPPFELPLCYVQDEIKPLPVGNGYSNIENGTYYVNNDVRIFANRSY